MVSVNYNNYNAYSLSRVNGVQSANKVSNTNVNKGAEANKSVTAPAFKSADAQAPANVRTQLITKEEKKKYNEISESLDGNYRKKLDYALKSGKLLKNDSDDNSSVLDNLHKILKEERDPGLDGRTLLYK